MTDQQFVAARPHPGAARQIKKKMRPEESSETAAGAACKILQDFGKREFSGL
jgi:hypothetical protein